LPPGLRGALQSRFIGLPWGAGVPSADTTTATARKETLMAVLSHAKPAAIGTAMPKSYLSAQEREALMHEGASANSIYLSESEAADDAGDGDASWGWLSLVELPAHSLMALKRRNGGQFIRDKNLNTTKADKVYGAGWLDRPSVP
jgi:hypothetical protein